MATDIRLKEALPEITESVVATYTECSHTSHLGHKPLPSREAVVEILCDLLDILYPGYWRRQNLHIGNVEYHVGDLIDGLHDKLTSRSRAPCGTNRIACRRRCARRSTSRRWPSRRPSNCSSGLPDIRLELEQDVQAAFEGDPAAKSYHEMIFCYPGLEAVTVYRIAHELLLLGVPLIPRMMTEHAHARPASTSIPAPASGRASSSITAPAWSSARRATSAETSSCTRA